MKILILQQPLALASNAEDSNIIIIRRKFTQSAITCLKLTIETLEQGVKYVQS